MSMVFVITCYLIEVAAAEKAFTISKAYSCVYRNIRFVIISQAKNNTLATVVRTRQSSTYGVLVY